MNFNVYAFYVLFNCSHLFASVDLHKLVLDKEKANQKKKTKTKTMNFLLKHFIL